MSTSETPTKLTSPGWTHLMVMAVFLLAACGSPADEVRSTATPSPAVAAPEDDAAVTDTASEQQLPDVIDAVLAATGDTWSLEATISSPYDTPERYADAFRALAPDGKELGIRVLTHDHAAEQPFTRTLNDLVIPDGVDQIEVQGRDLVNGWGGDTITVDVPPRP